MGTGADRSPNKMTEVIRIFEVRRDDCLPKMPKKRPADVRFGKISTGNIDTRRYGHPEGCVFLVSFFGRLWKSQDFAKGIVDRQRNKSVKKEY